MGSRRARHAPQRAAARLGDHGVSDDVWETAALYFEPPELAQLLWAIVAINAWNRLVISAGTRPGSVEL